MKDSSALAAKKNVLPFYYENEKLVINPFIRPFVSISDETPAAILEVVASPFNANRLLLVLTALNEEGYQLGMELLTNPKKFALINGNIVLAYKNGTFTSLQSQKLAQQASNQKRIDEIGNLVYIIGGGIVAAIVLFIIGLMVYRRIKRYFSSQG